MPQLCNHINISLMGQFGQFGGYTSLGGALKECILQYAGKGAAEHDLSLLDMQSRKFSRYQATGIRDHWDH